MHNIANIAQKVVENVKRGNEPTLPLSNSRNSLKTYSWWPVQPTWDGLKIDLSWHPDLSKAAQAIAHLSQAESGAIILTGHPGCGKSLLARIFLHSVGGQYRTVRYTDTGPENIWNAIYEAEPELLDTIRSSYGYENGTNQLIGRCANAETFILDDLGAGYVKDGSDEWYNALMWRFLDKRKGKRTLITTNLTPVEFKERIGERSFSRLKEVLGLHGNGAGNIIDLFAVPDYRAKDW